MAKQAGALAYRIGPIDAKNGDMRAYAFLPCATCDNIGKLSIAGIGNNPEKISKLFVRMNWHVDVHNAKKNFCPECVNRQQIRKEEDREKQRREATAKARVLATVETPEEPPTTALGVGLMDAIKRGDNEKPRSNAPAVEWKSLKDLPRDKKELLRTAMDSYFDAEKGRWEGDYNDDKVAEESAVPRVLVVEFRESFYGVLQEDPVIVALTQEIMQVKRMAKNLTEVTIPKLEQRIEELRKKRM